MRHFVIALLVGSLFYACGGDGSPTMQTSDLGNRYQLYTANGEGEPVTTGDFVYFHVVMRTEGDSIMLNTRSDSDSDTPVVQAAGDDNDEIGPVEDVVRFMRVGDSAVVRLNIEEIPSKPPSLQNDTVLLYDVVVTEIISEEQFTERQAAKEAEKEAQREVIRALETERLAFAASTLEAYNAGSLEGIQTTASGLKYVIHEEGTGAEAEAGKGVVVQYIGQLVSNGNVFDQSFARGEGIPFPLGAGRVIPGWDEGIDLLKEGAKATFFIPAELGYGAQGTPDGSIPGDSELAFYVELEEVQ